MTGWINGLEGRILDIQLVKEVLGWDLDTVARKTFEEFRRANMGKGMTGGETYDERYQARMLRIAIPPYSLDIEAAMSAAEETGLFKRYTLSQWQDGRWILSNHSGTVIVTALTAPLAICFAILKDKGIEPNWKQ